MILKQMNSANPPKLYTAAIVRQSLAEKVHSTLVVPGEHKVNCCSISDEKTKLGAHDIEGLVDFGMQPNIKRGVALYRG